MISFPLWKTVEKQEKNLGLAHGRHRPKIDSFAKDHTQHLLWPAPPNTSMRHSRICYGLKHNQGKVSMMLSLSAQARWDSLLHWKDRTAEIIVGPAQPGGEVWPDQRAPTFLCFAFLTVGRVRLHPPLIRASWRLALPPGVLRRARNWHSYLPPAASHRLQICAENSTVRRSQLANML
ncbi:hypothetical protein VTI74DRAFT_1898 [Chaetomium olivicolor]